MQGTNISSQHGFTLAELLVVMVIITIISLAGLNIASRSREYQVTADSIAFEMLSFINQAKLEGFLGKQQDDESVEHTRVMIRPGPYGVDFSYNSSLLKLFYLLDDVDGATGSGFG